MSIGSLFSGYGGLDMAVRATFGGDLAWYSEIEPAACTVLAAHHPGVMNLGDITKVDWATVPPVDILTGGYPCQPFSHAGLRKGKNDERHLWPYVRDAISALRPGVVVLENVAGHLTLGFSDVLGDLAAVGYDATWGVVRAADAGAPHGRKRLFILAQPADTNGNGHGQPLHAGGMGGVEGRAAGETPERQRARGVTDTGSVDDAADADGAGLQRSADRQSVQDAVQVRGFGIADGDSDASDAGRCRWDEGIHEPGDIGAQGREGAAALPHGHRADTTTAERVDWGKYEPAIRRWESITRPAPAPTVPGRNGRPRLNPAFVEWMMGLPAGHVTGHGLRPAQELKMLGNGVVPQQAALALSMLINAQAVAA